MSVNRIKSSIVAIVLVIVVLSAALYVFTPHPEKQDTLFQVLQFSLLTEGQYDGNTTFSELAQHGDFGIGTLNGLNGEMIALDGTFYQIPTSGIPREIEPDELTPYATVTFFEAEQTTQVSSLTYAELVSFINGTLPDYNAIYAIKVHGTYSYAETRSVPLQEKPYQPLAEVVKNQTVFNLNNVEGTAVGFVFPNSMSVVDYAGYHLHFITDEHDAGGHLLDCTIDSATVEIQQINNYQLVIP
ncbi:MAG: acetolactate decarboxylase [Candidatus Bathyarchaeota archaeon]|nr:acetolactate decarboxylase [Candidatus Bathyarchaeota archaeon]